MLIVQKGSFKVVGIQVKADWQGLHKDMPAAWQIFKQRVEEIPNRVNSKMIDVSLNYEAGIYTQLICVEVASIDGLPEGMVAAEIPAENYIHYHHEGSLRQIAESFGKMYRWAGEHNYEVDEFKIDNGYTQHGTDEAHDLYVKVTA